VGDFLVSTTELSLNLFDYIFFSNHSYTCGNILLLREPQRFNKRRGAGGNDPWLLRWSGTWVWVPHLC